MDSSANVEPQDPPINPSEPPEIDLADEEGFPPPETVEPAAELPVEESQPALEPAEPGLYWCEDEYTGSHPVLQQTIHQGENDLTSMTNPDELLAVAALVRDGVLRKMNGAPAHEDSQR